MGAIVVVGIILALPVLREPQNGEEGTPPPQEASDIPADIAAHIASLRDEIRVQEPRPLSTIASPFWIRGEARVPWFHEADIQVTLVDWDGRIIAENFLGARIDPGDESPWTTDGFVPFEGRFEFKLTEENRVYNRGVLIFRNANPSGLPQNATALEIPILFE